MQHQSVILLEYYSASAPSMFTFFPAVAFFVMAFAFGGSSGWRHGQDRRQRLCGNQNSQRCQEAYPGEDMTRVRGTVPVKFLRPVFTRNSRGGNTPIMAWLSPLQRREVQHAIQLYYVKRASSRENVMAPWRPGVPEDSCTPLTFAGDG